MSTVLSLLGVVLYIAVIISVAAALTWVVVRLVPQKRPQQDTTRS